MIAPTRNDYRAGSVPAPPTPINLLNKLTGVNMPRGSVTQTRTFNYDLTTGRLTSATNRKPAR